ncbi:TPM domain-containing protein [Flavimaricola marinus]|uniref:TPM domain-containing protein n=1 Tax=Flavimaricola marinus TaxID=1819565 RepID=A0A238LF95_9RHOB|nr:TPM domain-containing protein [Flavimaricola marinus]SMY07626.1 hypothetical protein LOM8899_01763 [Flavimaricola marinus]
MRSFILSLVATLTVGAAAHAQTYPSQSETPITDDAELLSPVQEAELAERIVQLEQETDSDVAVVTLPATQFYTMGDDVDVYAANLVAAWDMAGPVGNRHVLVVIFRDDRELAIEIGEGFGVDGPAVAAQIIEEAITPAFREDDYPGGIRAAVEAIATRVLAPAGSQTNEATATTPASAAAEADGDAEGGSNVLYYVGAGVAALIALIVGANRRSAAKLAATPCPACGKTGLTRERVTVEEATETAEGRGETRTICPSCGHVEAKPYTISKKEPKPAGEGKGGGAKGEW